MVSNDKHQHGAPPWWSEWLPDRRTWNNKRPRFLTEDEITTLLNECPKHLKSIVICALNTGMRRGEILSLKWSHIRNGLIYLSKTKTNEPRQIPINDTLEVLFSDLRKAQGLGAEYVFPGWWCNPSLHPGIASPQQEIPALQGRPLRPSSWQKTSGPAFQSGRSSQSAVRCRVFGSPC